MEHALNRVTALFDSIDVPAFMGGERTTTIASATVASQQKKTYDAHCHVTYRFRGNSTVKDFHYTPINSESQAFPSFSTELLYLEEDEEPVFGNLDIYTSHLILNYMEEYVEEKDKLLTDWKHLCAYKDKQNTTTSVAHKKSNQPKNLYVDRLPYDFNRVKLIRENEEQSDYVNANFVYDNNPNVAPYIMTQCPLANTVGDFWRMIWQQNVVLVINLTLVEDACHQYWPSEGLEVYDDYKIHIVSEHVWCSDYIVRSFYVQNANSGESRTLTQFHFLSWTVSSVPTIKSLLNFRRKVNKSFRGKNSPLVVHCSDGCGRSGAYVLLDMILNRLVKGVREIDIVATFEHLIDQRCNVVETKVQITSLPN